MMNERNPKGLDIRFIDSHYKDLFRLPDGGFIKMQYSNGEESTKKCTFIDEYHTQVGFNVFHICQFAEVMERNGTKYQPEPEMLEEQAAWKVGRDRFLAIQTCDDGYDFTLYDGNLAEIDGGQLDNPEMSMNEIRNEILEDFKLDKRDLVATDYDELTNRAMELEMQNVREQSVKTNIGTIPVEDYREIVAPQNGFDSYEDMKSQGISIDGGADKPAPKTESVLDQLSQKPEKKAPTKAPKHKEQER